MNLIINADDAGIDKGRNEGIFRCVEQGVVGSVSVIVKQNGWKDIKERIKKGTKAGIGFHFNLTAGGPLVKGHQTIAQNDAQFFSKFELFKKAMAGELNPTEVERELATQLEVFNQIGVPPAHIDGHNHVHLLPGVREGFLKIIEKGSWVRLPWERGKPQDPPRDETPEMIYNTARRLVRALNYFSQEAKNFWQDKFRYVDDFTGTEVTPSPSMEGFKQAVEGLQGEICELMCHPGGEAGRDAVSFSRLAERRKETQILTAREFKEFLKSRGCDIVSFDRLN